MLGGATFGFVNKIFKIYTFCAAFVLMAIGMFITIAADGIVAVMVGAVIVGCSISRDIPQSMLSITNDNAVACVVMAVVTFIILKAIKADK